MSMTGKRLRDLRRAIEGFGVAVQSVAYTGKTHLKLELRYLDVSRTFVAPNSPSDGRWLKNFSGDVRRWQRSVTSKKGEA